MNFDDEDDSDFSFSPQSNNSKLASLFKSGMEETSDESLKYKASVQPKPVQQQQPASNSAQNSTSVMFFSGVQAFKYLNNRYEPQGKLGLAVLSSPNNNYRILLYVSKTQPVATIRIGVDFKVSIQKNNYVTFYDETKQIWSILFDAEELIANFATQVTLCKCNLLQGNIDNNKLQQDLKLPENDSNMIIEASDSVEVSTLVSIWKDMKLIEIENTLQKPFKLKLGKNKLPQVVEELLINKVKQGDRKLFVLSGSNTSQQFKNFYPNAISSSSVLFYDINILRIKKNSNKEEERNNSILNNIDQMPPLPQLEQETRSRSESIKEKTKIINDQINDPKLEKAKVISRMAKLGQQMLPSGAGNIEDEWSLQNQTIDLQQQQLLQQEAQAKQALLIQNQQLQQQLAQAQIQNNQLALFKSPPQFPMNTNQVYMYPNQGIEQAQVIHQTQNVQPQPVQQNQTQIELPSNLLTKLDLINEKIDQIKSITNLNNQNMPNMETSILLQNIQRIVKENEQYKKDLYDKSAKIEEQNSKITELLMKAQNYVEQSHQILELKNNSFQTTAEKGQMRILELEKDKMKLTNELTQLTSQISELNLEINKLKKEDLEMRKQLTEVSKNTDQHKQNSDRLVVENADLQTKLDTVLAELKKERHLRKTNETKLQLNEEELNELRSNLSTTQKQIEEKKRKFDSDRSQFNSELEDLKRTHLNEINQYKEKLAKLKSNANESQNEQLKQIESDLNREWQQKLEKIVLQTEQKYERKLNELNDENSKLKKDLNDLSESIKSLKSSLANNDSDNDRLKHELEEMSLLRDKFERFQSQVKIMKERYENRIKELVDAEPDSEIVAEEVKKLMNAMYKKLKLQIKPDQYYSGNGILIAMLRLIKMITLQLLNSSDQSNEVEDVDYFSEHIYRAPEIQIKNQSTPVSPSNIPITTPSQISSILSKEVEDKENESERESASLSTIVKLALTSQNLIESSPAFDQVDEIEQESKFEEEKKDEFKENKEEILNETKESDEDDDIQLINDDDAKNDEFMVNDTLNKIEPEEEDEENKIESNQDKDQDSERVSNASDENIVVITDESSIMNKQSSQNETQAEVPDLEEHFEPENKQEEQQETPEKEVTQENKKPTISIGLFDDDDEESENETDDLFSFKPKQEAKLESLKAQESTENKTKSSATTNTSLNLKFSPPPLFDDEDDEADEKDIDWFK